MAGKSAFVFEVTQADFDEKVLKKSHEVPVVVDFWAPWCGPCRALTPILEAAIEKRKGAVVLAKVNTDEEQSLAMQFGIEGIPHVVGFRKGHPVVQFTGLLQEEQMTEFFDRLQPTEAEKQMDNAVALEKSNPAEAEKIYRAALEKKSDQEDAVVGLARLLIAQKKFDEASDILNRIGSAGDFGAEADKLRAVVWLNLQAKDLPGEEELHKKAQTNPKSAQAKFDLGCVQAVNGKTSEALETLYQAGLLDHKLATARVKDTMVKIFFVIGVRSELADAYRAKLTSMLY
ncbi:MAG: tetratricopeptide repeat protein [Planctomycetes bacterium]|nr:tetratricopeptide repeat protein [Planctomycetota bacterium]